MSLAKQIAAVERQRGDLIAKMETLVRKAEDADRALDSEEQASYDAIKREIETVVDARLKNLEDMEKISAARSAPVVARSEDPAPALSGARSESNGLKGGIFARVAHALYINGNNKVSAADYAERVMKDAAVGMVLRAAVNPAVTGTAAWAGALVDVKITDFINLLRPAALYGRIPAREITFDGYGSIKIKKQTGGVAGGWVSENAPIPVKAGAFSTVTLSPYKMGVISVASKEMLARSTPALEELLRDSMIEDTAAALDTTLIGSAAAGSGAPAGLFHTSNAAAVITGSNTGVKADDAAIDSEAMVGAMYTANVPMSTPVWLMHPSTELSLMNMRNAVGAYFFREEVIGGTWQRIPIITSTTLPRTRLGLVDAGSMIKGVGMGPEISVSTEATIQMNDAPVTDTGSNAIYTSLFQNDGVALRLTLEASWVTRYVEAVQWINDLKW